MNTHQTAPIIDLRISRQIALQASYEMGRSAAQQGADYFTGCKLTDAECRLRWADGFNSTREIAW